MPLISLLLKLKNCVFFDQRRFGYDHCGLFSANFGYFSTPAVFLVLLLWKFEQLLRKKCVISSLLVCNFSEFGCPLFYFCVNFCEKTEVLIGPQQLLWVQKLSFSNLEFIDQRYFVSRFTYFVSDVSHSAIIEIQWSVVRHTTCYFQHQLCAKPKYFPVCRSRLKNLTKNTTPTPAEVRLIF